MTRRLVWNDRIGLSVEQAEPLLFDTVALSIFAYAHERADAPAIALWNSGAHDFFVPVSAQA